MRSCKMIKFVDRYADNELDEKERSAFQGHIEKCSVCKERLDRALSLKKIYGLLDGAEIPFNFTATLFGALEESSAKDAFLQRRLEKVSYRLAPAFAAVAVILAIWAGVNVHNFNVDMDLGDFFTGNGSYVAGDIFEDIGG